MRISRKTFVIGFLVTAFAFQMISNSVLGPEVALFPGDREWFPGAESPIAWKKTLATVLYPVKLVLIGPLTFLGEDPDPPPPILLLAFAFYWTAIALALHFLLSKVFKRKTA